MSSNESCVYVVEDDEASRLSTVALLDAHGFHSRSFVNAEQLLECGPLSEGSCIVADLDLPGLNGLQLLERLRAQGEAIPMILISGHADAQTVGQPDQVGLADFLLKPVVSAELIDSVRRICPAQSS